ncbi:hypothetical protein PRIPAC_80711 [Pristionchus pacificus]|uniref:Uncharacterized protein n=1 Tax=Pristionchus pacificus TaxID=54126 RepID=A0A2A6BH95_PRIPA|nr:hypothetical protein PRIPAC_80711 [Pristionchus pacificus]|eukprot:PDM65181.1 hypothetical protein PRIPAC_52123 [Pristionchus pacificus]
MKYLSYERSRKTSAAQIFTQGEARISSAWTRPIRLSLMRDSISRMAAHSWTIYRCPSATKMNKTSSTSLHVDKLPTSPDKQGLFIADQGIHKLSPPSPNPNTRPLPGFGFPAPPTRAPGHCLGSGSPRPQPEQQATAWVRVPRAPNSSTRPLPGFGFPAPPTRAPGHCLEPVGIRQLDDSSRTRFYCGRQKMISSLVQVASSGYRCDVQRWKMLVSTSI